MDKILIKLLEVQNQIKIYHWSTHVYARHMASDKLFNQLVLNIDRFIETIQGSQNKRIKLSSGSKITISNKTDLSIVSYLKDFIQWLSIDLPEMLNTYDTDLLNIRDEILGDVNKTIYLFTFE